MRIAVLLFTLLASTVTLAECPRFIGYPLDSAQPTMVINVCNIIRVASDRAYFSDGSYMFMDIEELVKHLPAPVVPITVQLNRTVDP